MRWSERGIWEGIFSALAGAGDAPDRLFIDSSCIKVHRCAGGGKACAEHSRSGGALAHGIGLTRGGRNTKVPAVCDEQGRPCVLLLAPGNVHDCKVAEQCIEALPPSAELVADKPVLSFAEGGYDSQALRDWLDARGTKAIIPVSHRPRRHRHLVAEMSPDPSTALALFHIR